jgi:hypothetical protein
MTMRSVFSARGCRTIVWAAVAFWVAGCATDRLDAGAPSGVNLTGEWKLNLNLSDDPDKLGPDPDNSQKQAPGSHRGHGGRPGGMGGGGMGGGGMGGGGMGGGGMGLPPTGSPDDGPNYEFGPTSYNDSHGPAAGGQYNYGFGPTSGSQYNDGSAPAARSLSNAGHLPAAGGLLPVAFIAPGLEQSATLPPPTGTVTSGTTGNTKPSRGASINHLLRAPATLSITQNQGSVTIKANMPDGSLTADECTAGTTMQVPYGKDKNGNDQTAERTAGWRGPVFVVTTVVKKGGTREDDFAIDEDGRLIMTTQTKGGRLGKVEITRVYDRLRGAQ